MKNAGEPMYPVPHINEDGTIQHDVYFGLSKREHFAAMAMQGVLSHSHANNYTPNQAEDIARLSINLADELLKQLESK